MGPRDFNPGDAPFERPPTDTDLFFDKQPVKNNDQ